MAKATIGKKGTTTKVAVKKSAMKKRNRSSRAAKEDFKSVQISEPQKNAFEEKFGEGTAFDLYYGKLLIIGLCVYIAIQVS